MQILTMMISMMMMMSFLLSTLADQSLHCSFDHNKTFTCFWNTAELNIRPETSCFVTVTIKKRKSYPMEEQMFPDPTRPHIRSAVVVYKRKFFEIDDWDKVNEKVHCTNYTGTVAEIKEHNVRDTVVKVAPPHTLAVHNLSVSWTQSIIDTTVSDYQVQFRSAAQSWTDVKEISTEGTPFNLPEDKLQLQHQYVIRVRVKHKVLTNAVWSDWSEEYSWTSAVGRTPPPTPGVPEVLVLDWTLAGLMAGIALAISMCLILICYNRSKLQKKRSFYIPDPSKFFGDLNSHHGGNFTAWLGPILVRESLIKADVEFVSPVEVVKQQDSHSTHRHSGGLQDGWEDKTKSSNFSNSTYFLSQSSKGPSDVLEPCLVHSSYGPAGGVSGPDAAQHSDVTHRAEEKDELELSLVKLRQETQSPDSGFAGGAEDSMEESELPSPLALNPLPHPPPDLPAPHPVLHPLLGFPHTPDWRCLIPGPKGLELQSPCGTLEPASDDYMPVKNVQSEH